MQRPKDIPRESSEEEKMPSSAGELGRAAGTQGAHKSGQCCRETAVPRSSSCAQHSLQVTGGEQRKERELVGCVWCEQAVSSLEEHRWQPLTRSVSLQAVTLPPARLGAQPAWGAAQGAAGRCVGGRSPSAGQGRAGQGRSLLLLGAWGSQLQRCQSVSKGTLQEERQGRDFPIPVLREGE